MLSSILTSDTKLTLIINSLLPHNGFFNTVFAFLSLKGSSVVLWLAIVVFLILFEEKKDKRFIVYFLLSFLTTAFVVNIVLKNIFQRPRPVPTNFKHRLILTRSCPKDYSFPSGHASTAFTASVVLAAFDKKRKGFYYLLAGLISLSRIYLGCHFFLDVIAGIVIGYLIGKLFLKNYVNFT